MYDVYGVVVRDINAEYVYMERANGTGLKIDLSLLPVDRSTILIVPGAFVVVGGVKVNGRCIDVHAIHENCVDPGTSSSSSM